MSPAEPLRFLSGHTMKNRFMLAPMTNCQSHEDGRLSEDELRWLQLRAQGGFGLTMTCAAHVQEQGKGFPGQLGIFSDEHTPGHQRLAAAIRERDSLAVIQLHHAGMRSPPALIGQAPQAPSADEETGARGLSLEEVERLREDFIAAALRAQEAGYDGAEIHGAHGYILAQFLSPSMNRRTDRYGGSSENRLRLVFEILQGVRQRCGEGFLLGLRLSPERFGMRLQECRAWCRELIDWGGLDFLDISLWDCAKDPIEEEHAHRPLLDWFTELDRGSVRLTVAGKISSAREVQRLLKAGVDFVAIGRAGILHHDFPRRVIADPHFEAVPLPVTRSYLAEEGLSETFIDYMSRWKGFVAEEP